MDNEKTKKWVCDCVLELGYPAPKCKFCGGKGYWEEKKEVKKEKMSKISVWWNSMSVCEREIYLSERYMNTENAEKRWEELSESVQEALMIGRVAEA